MIYTEHKPHTLLEPYIECYWQADADRPPFREVESLIPAGCWILGYALPAGQRVW